MATAGLPNPQVWVLQREVPTPCPPSASPRVASHVPPEDEVQPSGAVANQCVLADETSEGKV